jgi:hypothetical protein
MSDGRTQHRGIGFALAVYPCHPFTHERGDTTGGRRGHVGSANKDRDGTELPCRLGDPLHDEPVQFENRLTGDGSLPLDKRGHVTIGGGVVRGFQVFAQGMATDGKPVVDDHLCFTKREGVAFDSIGVIGQKDAQIVTAKPPCPLEDKRPKGVESEEKIW